MTDVSSLTSNGRCRTRLTIRTARTVSISYKIGILARAWITAVPYKVIIKVSLICIADIRTIVNRIVKLVTILHFDGI